MRIRQFKPAFWTDPETGRWHSETQTFYMRLWNIADDAGWLQWEPDVIGALAYPYISTTRRLRLIDKQATTIYGKWLVLYECSCARLPKLEAHQRVTGKRSLYAFLKHQDHRGAQSIATYGYPPLTDKRTVAPVKSSKGSGKEVSGTVNGSAQAREIGLSTEGATK